MKKILLSSLLILSLLTLPFFALAEEAPSPIQVLFAAERDLLFDTPNVTMTGEASFWLDDAYIKTVELTHIQDGIRSMRDLQLYTPAFNYEPAYNSGYTVVTFDDTILAYEYNRPLPLQYIVEPSTQRNSILRRTVEGETLFGLAEAILDQCGSFGATSIEENEDGSKQIMIEMYEEDVPEVIQSLLNIMLQYGIDRYGNYVYPSDLYNEAHYTSFTTAFSGFIYCLRSIRLSSLFLSARLDPQGRFLDAGCSVIFDYAERNNAYTGRICAELSQGATDYGLSAIADDPSTYDREAK